MSGDWHKAFDVYFEVPVVFERQYVTHGGVTKSVLVLFVTAFQ